MILLKNVKKIYDKNNKNEKKVIDNTTLEMPETGMVAIYGKSGCGKTTLLNMIGGMTKLSEGSVLIDGKDISKNPDYFRNEYIGYVLQNYGLNMKKDVYENIADALKLYGVLEQQEIDSRVRQSLKCVGMDKYVNRMPETLSGGQRQRVAIARAIVKSPRIVLADEPTGNLDEKNMFSIMNILKKISEKRLVILVTHDIHLVNSYSDIALEIDNGQIIKSEKNGFGKDLYSNQEMIFENLEKKEIKNKYINIEYYGCVPDNKVELTILNYMGKIYIKYDPSQVQLIESKECVNRFENKKQDIEISEENFEELEKLPLNRICAKKIGKLFTWRSSINSGLNTIKTSDKRNKVLYGCLFLFAIVLVLITAYYGRIIEDIIVAKNANNGKVYYAYVSNEDVANRLLQAQEDEQTGIDYVRFTDKNILCDQLFYIDINQFDSWWYDSTENKSIIQFHGAPLAEYLVKELELACGKTVLNDKEMIITTKVADYIIDNSKFSFINSYDTLLGMTAIPMDIYEKFEIVGIVESEETAVYMSDNYFANCRYKEISYTTITKASDYNKEVKKGFVNIRTYGIKDNELPIVGDEISINGSNFIISEVVNVEYSYEEWLSDKKIVKYTEYETDKSQYEYLDYYYNEYKQYIDYCYENREKVQYDKYMEMIRMGCEEAWYISIMEITGVNNYYHAARYKRDNGCYPSDQQLDEAIYLYIDPYAIVSEYIEEGEQINVPQYEYVINDDDYFSTSNKIGKTTEYGNNEGKKLESYVVIHSKNLELTDVFLEVVLSDSESIPYMTETYISPTMLYEEAINNIKRQIIDNICIWFGIVLLLSVCISVAMYGNIINRVSEIAVYRCLGVRRINILFSYFVENIIIISLIMGSGYLLMSMMISLINNGQFIQNIKDVFYYPFWLGVSVYVFVFICLILASLLPVVILLKKEPSELMTKYDI